MITPMNSRGFTLVETLVAISILMISIVGPFYSVYKAVQVTYISRDQLIATTLAQEGVEYVRNVRDSNYLYNLKNSSAPVSWMNGLSACTGKNCTVDATENTAPTTCSGTCNPLYISSTNLYTQQVTGTATRFTRTVTITTVSANESTVTVTISWVNLHVPYTITISEHLYNWL